MTETVHISSLIIQVMPNRLAEIEQAIIEHDGAEVAASDPCGKLIVVMETPESSSVTAFADGLAGMPGVLSANLVFHHIDEAIIASGDEVAALPNGETR